MVPRLLGGFSRSEEPQSLRRRSAFQPSIWLLQWGSHILRLAGVLQWGAPAMRQSCGLHPIGASVATSTLGSSPMRVMKVKRDLWFGPRQFKLIEGCHKSLLHLDNCGTVATLVLRLRVCLACPFATVRW